jgi:hypothetical protein
MNTPVDFRNDPNHKAEIIHCDECRFCAWAGQGYCIYGGPFVRDDKSEINYSPPLNTTSI